jgi:phospholipid/cholesterol/gamma-HCH transport system permease protein
VLYLVHVDGSMKIPEDIASSQARVHYTQPATDCLLIRLTGGWSLKDGIPSIDEFNQQITGQPLIHQVRFDGREITQWDTSLLVFITRIIGQARQNGMAPDLEGLPEGVRRLMELAAAVPPKQDTGRDEGRAGVLAEIGAITLKYLQGAPEMARFLGEVTLSFGRLLRGKAQFRRADLMLIIQDVGPQALPIVSLISFLVGLIVAYMGAVQLAQFGAQIYIANLVSIGMVREMGALMTGIIMAGRTGAAFAAQLGTMQVNEEIDAFRTLGISPMDFLVMPRMLALIFVMPLLTLYSDLVGMLAGLFVANTAFDIGTFEYYHQTIHSLDLRQFAVGVSKGTTYGILIAFAGCLRGIQCGRSAQAVGQATTSAVVTSILFIVVAASLLTIIYQQLGI